MKTLVQFMKFGMVGVINTLASLVIYYILIYMKVNYMVATVAGYIISSVVGYLLNRRWVFHAHNTKLSSSVIKYYLVYGTSLLINMGCMYFWVDVLQLSQIIAPILTLCITVPYNYLPSKFWTFK